MAAFTRGAHFNRGDRPHRKRAAHGVCRLGGQSAFFESGAEPSADAHIRIAFRHRKEGELARRNRSRNPRGACISGGGIFLAKHPRNAFKCDRGIAHCEKPDSMTGR